MATQIPQPVIQIYNEVNIGKFLSTRHYELIETNFKPVLTDKLNISKDRKCANSRPVYWLKERRENKWSQCLTGLFKTKRCNVYKGDLCKKRHLILFKFSDNRNTLTVFIFCNYYSKDLSEVWHFIDK